MYPTLEKVKEIAASGEYRRIPVCKELYADRYTPVEVMRVLRIFRTPSVQVISIAGS